MTSTSLIILLCGVVTGILSARLLQPSGRGALAAVLFWPQLIAGLGALGIPEAITYRISQRGAHRSSVVTSGIWLSMGLSVITCVLAYVFLPHLLGPGRESYATLGQGYALLFLPAQAIAMALLAVDQGEQRFDSYNLLRLCGPVVYLLAILALWAAGAVSVRSLVIASVCGTVLAALSRLLVSRDPFRVRPHRGEMGVLLKYGVQFHVTAALVLLTSQMDKAIVLRLMDDAAVGLYAVAFTVASSGPALIAQSFHVIMFPSLARQVDIREQARYLARCLRYAMFILCTCTLVLAAATPWVIPFLFGSAFKGSVVTAIILLVGFVPFGLRSIIARGLRGLGRAGPGSIAELLALTVFLGISLPPAPKGLPSIALAFGIANLCALMFLAVQLNRVLGLSLREWWGITPATATELMRRWREVRLGNFTDTDQ